MQKIAIIIPHYNEECRISESSLSQLLQLADADIYLTDDGSTDNTLQQLNTIAARNETRCFVISYPKNQGKGTVIYKSTRHLMQMQQYDYIGYIDADFSTPVTEVARIVAEIEHRLPAFIFGSRILLMNAGISRKWYRHIIGRVIVTVLNLKFRLSIYDTQCGAKFFSAKAVKTAFENEFYTSWLFDVEIFLRLKKENMLNEGIEFPLQKWTDIKGSKLNLKSAFKILAEINLLTRNY